MTTPLTPIRKKIDALDAQLLALLNERADLVHEVGEIKRRHGGSVFAPEREEALLRTLAERNAKLGGRLPATAVRAIYREIMSASYALEKGLTIAYFGPAGTYTHEAARNKFGASVEYAPQPGISDVFAAVARGSADFGVVPIENSTEGAVTHTLDEFMGSELKICAEILLRVEQNLLAKCPRGEIRKIYSHPQSLGQCRQWLQTHFPTAEVIASSSNTRAAQHAAEEPGAAAIAGKLAAELYGLNILEASIQDCAFNTTRFLVIGPQSCPPTGNDKTSLMFTVRDESGALFSALKPFQRLGISMSKIESRPSRRKAWEYYFFVDIGGHGEDPRVVEALDELGKHCTRLKVLGSYPRTA
ncbi:MAG: prephenate dehydratase [Chthoniobacteraceae bacterium]|nr:prephenate dehydratase [Chthoniobacteraceae bacterium]